MKATVEDEIVRFRASAKLPSIDPKTSLYASNLSHPDTTPANIADALAAVADRLRELEAEEVLSARIGFKFGSLILTVKARRKVCE